MSEDLAAVKLSLTVKEAYPDRGRGPVQVTASPLPPHCILKYEPSWTRWLSCARSFVSIISKHHHHHSEANKTVLKGWRNLSQDTHLLSSRVRSRITVSDSKGEDFLAPPSLPANHPWSSSRRPAFPARMWALGERSHVFFICFQHSASCLVCSQGSATFAYFMKVWLS